MEYIKWHYLEVWPRILILWRNLMLFPFYYFSVPLHLKTFFAPWHRQQTKMKRGFHLDDFLGTLSFNIISRILGAILRTITIFYGLLLMTVVGVLWLVPVVIWPLIPIFTLPSYLAKKPKKEEEVMFILAIVRNDPARLMNVLLKQPIGKFIISHLGIVNQPRGLKMALESSQGIDLLQFTNLSLPQLFQKMAEIYLPFKTSLDQNNLKSEDVIKTALWFEKLHEKNGSSLIMDLPRIKNLQGIGHNWAYGYTVELDKLSHDLTRDIPAFPLLVGREEEIATIERVLLKTEANNVIVAGEPGVARHLLVETLAYRILSGHAQPALGDKRILSVNMHALVSSKPSILEVKGLAEELLAEASSAGNIIISVDEIDKFVSSGEGRIDLSDVISKFAESTIGVIGITTPFAYHKFIQTNTTLSPLFEKVEVDAFPKERMLEILEISIAPILERKYRLVITYPAIVRTIDDADRYITQTPFPAKAIELLDEACVDLVTKRKKYMLTAQDIDTFLTDKMHMPLGDLQKKEAEKLANLENLLHQRIINQEEAIRAISAALRRARLNVGNPNRPIGTFLFLGPTGVGKTETAKALATVYFNSVEKLIRFDMSQYQKEEGLERLIGSAKSGSPGELTSKLADNPFSVLLLDEFEKADREIYNLFLTLLDEGYITDAIGRKIFAKNNIIIATSNAGGEFIREKINQGIASADLQKELIEHVQQEKIFSPELINRFDAAVVFTPLTEGQLREVAKLMLDDLNKRLLPKEISLFVDQELIRKIASLGFDPQFGARSMRRAISENIEDQIAQKLLAGEAKKGEQIQVQL